MRPLIAALCLCVAPLCLEAQTRAWLCKDGTTVTTASDSCRVHGGIASAMQAATVAGAPRHSVAARCKDGTTEFYKDSTSCRTHGGVNFTFPAAGLPSDQRALMERADSAGMHRSGKKVLCGDGTTVAVHDSAAVSDSATCRGHGGVGRQPRPSEREPR